MRPIFPGLLSALILSATLTAAPPPGSPGVLSGRQQPASQEAAATQNPANQPARRGAIPVRDVDSPGLNPFHHSFEQRLEFLLPDAESTFIVPEGRRLVIEHISVLAQGQASASSPWGLRCVVTAIADGEPGRLIVDLTPVGFQGGLNQVSAANLHGRAYADGGSVVTTRCTRVNFSSRSVGVGISIVGHLVDERMSSGHSSPSSSSRAVVPVPVRDVDAPGRNPFQRSFHLDASTPQGVAVAVPDTMRLVIEQVSLRSAGPTFCVIAMTADGAPANLFVATVSPSSTAQAFIASEQIRGYADGGEPITTRCTDLSTLAPVDADVSIIGYLVSQ